MALAGLSTRNRFFRALSARGNWWLAALIVHPTQTMLPEHGSGINLKLTPQTDKQSPFQDFWRSPEADGADGADRAGKAGAACGFNDSFPARGLVVGGAKCCLAVAQPGA
jgi:hypothetical protein